MSATSAAVIDNPLPLQEQPTGSPSAADPIDRWYSNYVEPTIRLRKKARIASGQLDERYARHAIPYACWRMGWKPEYEIRNLLTRGQWEYRQLHQQLWDTTPKRDRKTTGNGWPLVEAPLRRQQWLIGARHTTTVVRLNQQLDAKRTMIAWNVAEDKPADKRTRDEKGKRKHEATVYALVPFDVSLAMLRADPNVYTANGKHHFHRGRSRRLLTPAEAEFWELPKIAPRPDGIPTESVEQASSARPIPAPAPAPAPPAPPADDSPSDSLLRAIERWLGFTDDVIASLIRECRANARQNHGIERLSDEEVKHLFQDAWVKGGQKPKTGFWYTTTVTRLLPRACDHFRAKRKQEWEQDLADGHATVTDVLESRLSDEMRAIQRGRLEYIKQRNPDIWLHLAPRLPATDPLVSDANTS